MQVLPGALVEGHFMVFRRRCCYTGPESLLDSWARRIREELYLQKLRCSGNMMVKEDRFLQMVVSDTFGFIQDPSLT